MKRIIILLAFVLAAFNMAAQEENIVRYLQIEKGGDDYEILNIADSTEYSIRTETNDSNKLVVRVYNENDRLLGEYPENSIIYPLWDEEPVLGPNTIIIPSEQNEAQLINLEEDLIVFRQCDTTLSYQVGNILFGAPSFEAPDGYLRTLISKEVKDGQVIFETEFASLLDAFDELSIHRLFDYETLIDEETGETKFELVGVNGVRIPKAMYNVGELSFSISKDIMDSLLSINFTFKGQVQLEFVFKAKKFLGVPYDVNEFKLVGHFSLDANLLPNISAKITLVDKKLGQVALPNITIPILGIPLILRNEVVFKLDAKSEVGIKFNGGVNGKITVKTGVHYKSGKLNGIASFDSNFNVSPLVLVGSSDKISLSIIPQLEVTPYGIEALTGFVNLKFGPTFTIQNTAPQWKVSLGGNVNAGLKIDLLGFLGFKGVATAKYEYSSPSFNLASWQGNFTPDKPTVSTLSAYNIDYSQATLKGNVTAQGLGAVTNRGFQWGLNTYAMNNTEQAGTGLGAFEKKITELQDDRTYFYRTYATNTYGTAYGEVVSFKSNPLPNLYLGINPLYNATTNSVTASAQFSRAPDAMTVKPDEYGFVWTTNSFPTAADLSSYPYKISV